MCICTDFANLSAGYEPPHPLQILGRINSRLGWMVYANHVYAITVPKYAKLLQSLDALQWRR